MSGAGGGMEPEDFPEVEREGERKLLASLTHEARCQGCLAEGPVDAGGYCAYCASQEDDDEKG